MSKANRLEILIDERGILWIHRKGVWVKQWCKYRNDVFCSDSCKEFSEPQEAGYLDQNSREPIMELKLCDKHSIVGDIIDERSSDSRKQDKQ